MAPPEFKGIMTAESFSNDGKKRTVSYSNERIECSGSSSDEEKKSSKNSSGEDEVATSVCISAEKTFTSLPKKEEEATPECVPEKKKLKPEDFTEERCLSVWWKIKSFSFCYPLVSSAEFCVDEFPYIIEVYARSTNVDCEILCLHPQEKNIDARISFLTCDGSPEESIICELKGALKVPKDVIFGDRRSSFLPDDTLTVRIQVLAGFDKDKIFMCSEMGVKRRSFFWTLKNFSNYRHEAEKDEERMQKTLEDSERHGEIFMFFKPEGKIQASEHYSIHILRRKGKACFCQLKVDILGTDGVALNCVDEEFAFDDDEQETRVFHSILKKKDLLSRVDVLLPNDTLSLKCKFALSTGEVINEKYVSTPSEVDKFLVNDSVDLVACCGEEKYSSTDLSTDLKRVLENGPFFDVGLHVDSQVIEAHKILLSARSPVFRSMLTQDESKASLVIEDLDEETMRKLIVYMYTDTMSNCQREDTKRLYVAANRYRVLNLKKKCLSLLVSNLSISNVWDTLVFADSHGDEDVKAAALHFIFENEQAFFAWDKWEEIKLQGSPLLLEVMSCICSNRRTKKN